MKKLLFVYILFVGLFNLNAQNSSNPKFNVPEQYTLVAPEDYTKYEPQLMQTIDWYLWRSMAFDADKRKSANEFFIKWVTGSPTVTVDIHTDIVNFIDTTPELLIPFTMGWVKYSIDNNYSKDRIKACSAGIRTAVDYYNKNRSFFTKNENIEKYDKMKEDKLEKYINKVFASIK